MHVLDQRVGGDHELLAATRPQHRRVVADPEPPHPPIHASPPPDRLDQSELAELAQIHAPILGVARTARSARVGGFAPTRRVAGLPEGTPEEVANPPTRVRIRS